MKKFILILAVTLAIPALIMSAPADRKKPRPPKSVSYTIHAAINLLTATGVFVEVRANDIYLEQDGLHCWTQYDGEWVVKQQQDGQETLYAQRDGGVLSISTPYQITQIRVSDFVFVPDEWFAHYVLNTETINAVLPGGEYWIDFDASGLARISTAEPPDFGHFLSDGSPNPSIVAP